LFDYYADDTNGKKERMVIGAQMPLSRILEQQQQQQWRLSLVEVFFLIPS